MSERYVLGITVSVEADKGYMHANTHIGKYRVDPDSIEYGSDVVEVFTAWYTAHHRPLESGNPLLSYTQDKLSSLIIYGEDSFALERAVQIVVGDKRAKLKQIKRAFTINPSSGEITHML